jgi:uncharacterized protein YihD (DUF1040 family)
VRDPKRIEPMLDLIRTIWTRSPDLRLGQLISNTTVDVDDEDRLYHIEDEELAEKLKILYR